MSMDTENTLKLLDIDKAAAGMRQFTKQSIRGLEAMAVMRRYRRTMDIGICWSGRKTSRQSRF